MKAAALHDHGDALERAAHEVTLVPGRPGLGEPGDLAVWDAHGTLDRIRDPSQPRAEHDRDARLELPESPRHDVGRLLDRTAPRSPLPAAHSSIPASVADRKFASVPAIVPLSCHGTPMTQAIGRKIQPSTVWMLSGNHVT